MNAVDHPHGGGHSGFILGHHNAALGLVFEIQLQFAGQLLPQPQALDRERQLALHLLVPQEEVPLAGTGAPGRREGPLQKVHR